ncbi:MAG: pilus assembly protein PilM [Caulobacteraceae bacterium]
MPNKLFVEIDNDRLKYLYASKIRNRVKIKRFNTIMLPKNCFNNGILADKALLSMCLEAVKKEIKKSRCEVYLTINDGNFITRTIELPLTNEKDIEKHLSLEVEQYLPINRENYQVDFKVLEKYSKDDEAGSKVFITAGPKDNIVKVLDCFDSCGLRPKVLDIYANNICRLFSGVAENDIAVLDLGMQNINITIMEDGKFYMHSYISSALKAIVERYSETAVPDSFSGYESHKDGLLDDGLQEELSSIIRQISRYLDYFNSRHYGKAVDRIYVIGENAGLIGLAGSLKRSYNAEISIGLEGLPVVNADGHKDFYEKQTGYCSLLGLALRGTAK